MNCFNHPSIPAIGMCKHCNKGLCADCASDLGHGLACRDKHEQEVEGIQVLMRYAFRMQAIQRKFLPFFNYTPFLGVFAGLLFLVQGLYSKTHPSDFLAILGTGLLVYSMAVIAVGLKPDR